MPREYGFKLVDHHENCPYLQDREAILPFYLADFRENPALFDDAMEQGYRRSGAYIYRTNCDGCQACEPIRLPVAEFQLRRRHRRVLKKTGQHVQLEIGKPMVDQQRVDLYNRHKMERGLGVPGSGAIDLEMLNEFLGVSCCNSLEFRYFVGNKLVGVAIADVGEVCMSAVYCYYDSTIEDLSIGTFSVLKQIEACREWGLTWLYLGFFIEQNVHMSYKASYLPHQRKIDGVWQRFDLADSNDR